MTDARAYDAAKCDSQPSSGKLFHRDPLVERMLGIEQQG